MVGTFSSCETPGNRFDRQCLDLETRKRWTSEGYCGRGRRSKARLLREKNPMQSRVGSRVVGMPDPWKSPIPLDDTGLLRPIKDGIRGLDFASPGYPYSLTAGERFRATSPCLLRLVALRARFWRQICARFSGLSTDVDVAVETSGAGRGLWRMGRCTLLRLLRDGRTGGASFRGPCEDLSQPLIGKNGCPGSNLTSAPTGSPWLPQMTFTCSGCGISTPRSSSMPSSRVSVTPSNCTTSVPTSRSKPRPYHWLSTAPALWKTRPRSRWWAGIDSTVSS